MCRWGGEREVKVGVLGKYLEFKAYEEIRRT